MAKKTTSKRTTKKPLIHRLKTYNFFLVFAVLLGMIAGVYMVKFFYNGEPAPSDTIPQVQLGRFEYKFENGVYAKKISDQKTKSLEAFLENEVKNSGCGPEAPDLARVRAFTQDRSQVLLDYGCGGGANMFVVLKDGKWRALSPTNHFDVLYSAVAECGYVKKNDISKTIAPVCYAVDKDDVTYHVR